MKTQITCSFIVYFFITAIAQSQVANRWTNSLGMIFVPVPQTTVRFCIWETRNQDYRVFVEEGQWGRVWPQKPPFERKPADPVVNVGWDDAKDFCIWLTQHEHQLGLISSNQVYRLPSDFEWSCAVGITNESKGTAESRDLPTRGSGVHPLMPSLKSQYPKEEAPPPGNYAGTADGFKYTAPVGSYPSNELGIYDLYGNVWEWCMDYADDGKRNILRGGSWANGYVGPYIRDFTLPDNLIGNVGFRCVLVDAPSSL